MNNNNLHLVKRQNHIFYCQTDTGKNKNSHSEDQFSLRNHFPSEIVKH